VKFGPRESYLATGSEDHTVKVWSVPDGALKATIDLGELLPLALDLAPDGERVLVVTNDPSDSKDFLSSRVWLWDVSRRVRLSDAKEAGGLRWAEFDPSGTTVVGVALDGTMVLLDAGDGHRLRTLDIGAAAMIGTVSSDGRRALLSTDRGPRLVSLKENRPPVVYPEKNLGYLDIAAAEFQFSSDGTEFAFSYGGRIDFYAADKVEQHGGWDLYGANALSVDFLASSNRVVAALLGDNSIEVFDRPSGTVRAHVAWSNEGYKRPSYNVTTDRLAVKWSDNTVRIYPLFRSLDELATASEAQFPAIMLRQERMRYLGN
jgi:WD40 repeat protein